VGKGRGEGEEWGNKGFGARRISSEEKRKYGEADIDGDVKYITERRTKVRSRLLPGRARKPRRVGRDDRPKAQRKRRALYEGGTMHKDEPLPM